MLEGYDVEWGAIGFLHEKLTLGYQLTMFLAYILYKRVKRWTYIYNLIVSSAITLLMWSPCLLQHICIRRRPFNDPFSSGANSFRCWMVIAVKKGGTEKWKKSQESVIIKHTPCARQFNLTCLEWAKMISKKKSKDDLEEGRITSFIGSLVM